jgi:hypothetical protein
VAAYFFDSSALVKRYLVETGTAWVQALCNPAAGHRLYLVRIASVEVISAVTRRVRGGGLIAADAAAALAQFRLDFQNQYLALDATAVVVSRAETLAETYGLRAYDAIHLAAALNLNDQRIASALPPLNLVSSDTELNAAAATEGLTVEDPNSHP